MNSLSNYKNSSFLFSLISGCFIILFIVPIPDWVLDLGIAFSFSLSICILCMCVCCEDPIDLVFFPTLIIFGLIIRLVLNISSTKLIIGEGHSGHHVAGDMIEGFSNYVIQGDLVIGIVVFLVILCVNFLVITKGASRMAEVGARFALDGMPGKQMAIDSDLSSGAISHLDAQARRAAEQKATDFYGSLDGASKFVKGDAVAGLLIVALNFFVGLMVGVFSHGMEIGDAVRTFSTLTIGDGLVSQLPAVFVSVGAAILLSRQKQSEAETTQRKGRLLNAVLAGSVVAAILALIPGLPTLPFLVAAIVSGLVGWNFLSRNDAVEAEVPTEIEDQTEAAEKLGDCLSIEDIHVEFAQDLIPFVVDPTDGLTSRISSMRRYIATEYGVIIPEVRLSDSYDLPSSCYRISIRGIRHAEGEIRSNSWLAISSGETCDFRDGEETVEPVYGAPAFWIDGSRREAASLEGLTVVAPIEVMSTHLLETVKSNFARIVDRRLVDRLLAEFVNVSDEHKRAENQELVSSFIPDPIGYDKVVAVLRLLLEEGVSVRDLPMILESMAEALSYSNDIVTVSEHVRKNIGQQITSKYRSDDGYLTLIQLSHDWENKFADPKSSPQPVSEGASLAPEQFKDFARSVGESLVNLGSQAAGVGIVTSAARRRLIRTVLSAHGISNPVFSLDEVGSSQKIRLVGTI